MASITLVPVGTPPQTPYSVQDNLDQLQTDLGSSDPGQGAALIGVEPNGCFTSTDLQSALEEICAGGGGGGAQGFQGAQGAQGFQGSSTGNQGFQGATGTQGFQGATGTQGFQGFQGFQGATGTGNQGFQGATGPQGFQGSSTGNQGFQGATGTQGFQGFQGGLGAQGFQGFQGFQGATGNQGSQGAQGFQGSSIAANVTIVDAGGYYVSTDVEGALQEIGAAKGAPLGFATLDAGGKVDVTQLPTPYPLHFVGTWDANTNTPDIAATAIEGDAWVVQVAGNTNLSGITDWQVGDWAIYDGAVWYKLDNSNFVISVNGQTGIVTITKSDVGLGNVEDTALSTWAGSTNLTTLGTVATGTWNASTLDILHGGTGGTTKSAAFDNLSPTTTLGDVIYGGAAGTGTRLAGNITTTRQFLRQTGTGAVSAAPAWDTVTKADVGLGNVENTALSTWAGSTNITTLGTISTGTVPAANVSIVDAGNYFTGSDVESAFQQIGLTGILNGIFTFSSAAVQSILTTATQITPTTSLHRINNTTAGNISLTSSPTISTVGATLGKFLILYHAGLPSAKDVTMTRSTANALKFSASTRTIGPGGMIGLLFDGTNWVEMFHVASNTAP